MSDITRVYWKRKEDVKESSFISGCCAPDGVPSYGEVSSCPLPTTVQVSVDEDGTIFAKSPPIIGSSFAYRYHLTLTPHAKERLATASEYEIEQMLDVKYTEAPVSGSSRENWWWYAQNNFHYLGYRKKTPVSLMKKWKRAMLEILLETHPDKDKILAKWDNAVASHNRSVKRTSKSRGSAHKRAHGDLVVMPKPNTFYVGDCAQVQQIFQYNIEKSFIGRRDKHSLHIKNVRYKMPHGSAMTFKDGTAPDPDLSTPIRLAMCLLAWSRKPLGSAHAILNAKLHFEPMANQLFEEIKDISPVDQNDTKNFAAAISALSAFRFENTDASTREAQELERINALIDQALKVLQVKVSNFEKIEA